MKPNAALENAEWPFNLNDSGVICEFDEAETQDSLEEIEPQPTSQSRVQETQEADSEIGSEQIPQLEILQPNQEVESLETTQPGIQETQEDHSKQPI